MRVLTFNSHQPYIHTLATALPWEFGVVTPDLPSGRRQSWNAAIRPVPGNVQVYESIRAALRDHSWDWILTHNVHDLLDCRTVSLPKVFLVHGSLSGRMLQDKSSFDREEYLRNLSLLLESQRCEIVYISRLKSLDWSLVGRIIQSAVDPSQYGGYSGARGGILRVGSNLRERGAMLGWEAHRIVCSGLPTLVIGANRAMPGSRMGTSWDDLREQYRLHRVYLNTAVYPYEDGYNLAMLEAMATGMPIATMEHPTSPIEDGIEGVVGRTPSELREKVLRLLDDPEAAARMGTAARIKLEKEFPLPGFRSAWAGLASELVG